MNKKVLKRRVKYILDPIYHYIRRKDHRRNYQYTKHYEKSTVKDHTILYESRDGKSLTDNPYAIFKYLVDHPEYKEYQHIWSVNSVEELRPVISQYKQMKNVKFVIRNSREYLKRLATSKYLINNSTFQSYFIPKKEQVYINTWHGTPLKSMGFDIPGNPAHSQNVVRNFLSSDYLLSPNEHTTNMFLHSYKLKGIHNGEIIQEGYPRIDLTYHTKLDSFQSFLTELGLTIDPNKQTILYAPTWKGTSVSKAKNDMYQIISDMAKLKYQVGEAYNILIKVHPFLYDQAKKFHEVKEYLVPDFVDTNELLGMVDILITDYSSIFFDFLVTDKPILFYIWDYDDYQEERGLYFSDDELPGPTLFTIQEVAGAIQNILQLKEAYSSVYQASKQRFVNHDDGNVTKRIIDYIFQKRDVPLNIIRPVDTTKKRILIYPGGLMNNGITSSFINLTDNIDFDKYDVSVFMNTPTSKEALNNIVKVNKKARFLFRNGLAVHSLNEVYRDKFVHNRGAHTYITKKLYPENAYQREHKRLFGRSQFDYAIDFSGYSLYWAKYLLASDAKKKICYMHNDILSDSERNINGRRPHRINLRGLFSVYDRFDKLVSVSPGTMELNKNNLSEFAEEFKFDYVLNSINPEKILRMGNEGNSSEMEEASAKGTATEEIISNHVFQSRALIKTSNDYFVYNRPAVLKGAVKIASANDYFNKEAAILREAKTESATFYKFSIDDSIVGWLDKNCFELLPDSILFERQVNKLARIQYVYGHDIWSLPYKTEGTQKISSSRDYKGLLVDVDLEVRTQRGIYSRFSIKGNIIGWIQSSALSIIKEYETKQRFKGNFKISMYKMVQSNNYKKIIRHRTLEEKNLYELAKISHPGAFAVWSKPSKISGSKKVLDATELVNEKVIVTKCNKTPNGTYYFFYHDGKKMGWLDQRAFTIIEESVIFSEKDVKRIARINSLNVDEIWDTHGGPGGNPIKDYQRFNGKTVMIIKEARTIDETYCLFAYEDETIGWLNKRSFHIIETLGLQKGRVFIPMPSKENYNFITMGRLSPEKGQDNLIKAFGRFHKDFAHSKLYILGEGPLRKDLEQLISELGLDESVYLAGQVENPFAIMKKCDCFVLSSHYEGQPMVLLEAMTHGMKIIATDIVANRTVLEDNRFGVLVENSIEGLEKGLNQLARDELDNKLDEFIPEEYNKKAMATFYNILESEENVS